MLMEYRKSFNKLESCLIDSIVTEINDKACATEINKTTNFGLHFLHNNILNYVV